MGDIMTVPFAAAPRLSCCCNVLYAGLERALLRVFWVFWLMFSLYASLFCFLALIHVQGSLFPLWSRESVPLVFRVLLLVFTKESVPLVFRVLLLVCTRESVPFAFCSASLSCFWFGQGILFPFPCIAGLQLFLIYTILTFDKKKKKDWDLILESRNRSDRSVTQWKSVPRHQHYWNE